MLLLLSRLREQEVWELSQVPCRLPAIHQVLAFVLLAPLVEAWHAFLALDVLGPTRRVLGSTRALQEQGQMAVARIAQRVFQQKTVAPRWKPPNRHKKTHQQKRRHRRQPKDTRLPENALGLYVESRLRSTKA